MNITIQQYDYERCRLSMLMHRARGEYDDIHLPRHIVGETYVEFVHLGKRAWIHGFKSPIVEASEKEYGDVCRMILPSRIEMRRTHHLPEIDRQCAHEYDGNRLK